MRLCDLLDDGSVFVKVDDRKIWFESGIVTFECPFCHTENVLHLRSKIGGESGNSTSAAPTGLGVARGLILS